MTDAKIMLQEAEVMADMFESGEINPAMVQAYLEEATPDARGQFRKALLELSRQAAEVLKATDAWALNTEKPMTGYKLGEGKKANRSWIDEQAAAKALAIAAAKKDLNPASILELKSPAKIDNMLGPEASKGLTKQDAGRLAVVPDEPNPILNETDNPL